jgi:RNA polymerase sigma factor (sigma-70 family)
VSGRAKAAGGGDVPSLAELLVRHRMLVVRWMERHATALLRYESAEDLAQHVALRALEGASRYEHRGEKEFVGWVLALARQVVSDRAAWWGALKRDAGPVLRLTQGGGSRPGGAAEPGARRTGPATAADRRERLDLATRALGALPERDAELVRHVVRGVSIAESAERFGIGPEAAQRARLRAVERLRKVFALAARGA